jgi:nitrogen fixation/metabolism regulation signal transduction histidine kinase
MAVAKRIRSVFLTLLAVLGIALWLIALLSFTRVTENNDDFAQRQTWILLINSVGIAVLLALIVRNLWQLLRDHRRHVPGSRLRARMVSVLVMVAITPLVGVYIFSVEFINRGIDNWLNVDVEKGLGDALELGQTVLDIQTRGRLEEVHRFALQLADGNGGDLATKLNALRASSDALELTVYGQNQILGITSIDPEPRAPRYPTDEVLLQLRQQGQFVSVEPQIGGEYQILAAAAFTLPSTNDQAGFLQAKFPLEQRLSTLANAVQSSYNQVKELSVALPTI